MPNLKVDQHWIERVRSLAANEQRGAKHIRGVLEREALAEGLPLGDVPSERTIGRELSKFRGLDRTAQNEYLSAHWPESFEQGSLPWEAATPVLDLIRHTIEAVAPRPSIRLARCFWHVSQAAPGECIEKRLALARQLSLWKALPHDENIRGAEAYLAYTPWHSAAAAGAYSQAVQAGRIEEFASIMAVNPGDSVEAIEEGLVSLTGRPDLRASFRQLAAADKATVESS